MKTRIVLVVVCFAICVGGSQSAFADDFTEAVLREKIKACLTGKPDEGEKAFEFLYLNKDRCVPMIYDLIRRETGAEERTAMLAVLQRISEEEINSLQNNFASLQNNSARHEKYFKALTDYGLKDSHFIFAIVLSVGLFIVIVDLVRRKLLRIEYSWLWVLTVAGILVLISTGLLNLISLLIGARIPQTLFFAGVAFLTMITLHFSVTISKLSNQVKNLSQELAILKHESEEHLDTGHSEKPDEQE